MRDGTARYGIFEWDLAKAKANLLKHGVDFFDAIRAFLDKNRIIAVDDAHSDSEPRYYCVGKVDGKIVTVRFVYRKNFIRIFGAAHWRKGKKLYGR